MVKHRKWRRLNLNKINMRIEHKIKGGCDRIEDKVSKLSNKIEEEIK